MEILTVSRRRTEAFSDAEFEALLESEAEAARALYASGIVRSIWSRQDVPGACMLVEARDVDHARELLATLPFVSRGMLEVQYVPLRGYRGFGPRQ